MNNFILRTLTGALFLLVLIGGMVWDPISYGVLFLIITVLTTKEFCSLVNSREGVQVNTFITSVASGMLFATFYVYAIGMVSGIIFLPYLLTLLYILVSELYRKQSDPIQNWAYVMMTQIYVALPFSLLNMLAFSTLMTSTYWLFPLCVFIFIWMNDTGAYCVGSLLHNVFPAKLFPRISPKKSWVGSIGGGILTMAASVLIWSLTNKIETDAVCTILTLPQWIGFALVVVVFGTWGDLVESLIKRTLGIKDSGNILPGHGGMLDRFDSSLLAIPASVIYLYSLQIV